MFDRLKNYLSIALSGEFETEEDIMNECKSKANSALFLMLISMILTLLNVYSGWWFMAGTTAILILGFAAASFFASNLNEPRLSAGVMAVMVGFIFSVYIVTGENEGFAALWVLLVPLIGANLLNMKSWLLLGAYFQILLILLFYTPYRTQMAAYYSNTFLVRFPILYFCSFGSSAILTLQRQYYVNLVKRNGNRDTLTDLWNRNAFVKYMNVNQGNRDLCVAFMDLNGLKDVNDTLGHAAGDEYIRGCAECMRKAFTQKTFLARVGGDEFAAVGICSKDEWESMLDTFRTVTAGWQGVHVKNMTMAMGTVVRRDYEDLAQEQLLKIADIEMYREKTKYYQTVKPKDFEYDYLTGLTCSSKFHREGNLLLDTQAEDYTLLYIDYIRFKAVNDIFGVAAGDAFLRAVGAEIRKNCTSMDLPCRLSGDRFAVLLYKDTDVEDFAAKIHLFNQTYDLPYEISCNMGIYRVEPGVSMSGCLDRTILALSTIKGSYVEKQAYYTDSMRKQLISEQEIAGIAGAALSEHQFVPYFQPQYDSESGKMRGAECLARWNHPQRGLVAPSVFIPIMEKVGYISQLDMYMFEENCRFLKKIREQGLTVHSISANFSRYDIFAPDFVERLDAIRDRYGVKANELHIEITESTIHGNSQKVNQIVKSLHNSGYIVEIDDFGSGYSSLNVLKDIDFDILKLDMRFLASGEQMTAEYQKKCGTIIDSVVRMSNSLSMPVIAEGVETLEQANYLKSIGCTRIQGYYYAKPMPEEEFIELLKKEQTGSEG